jgi:acetylornithine deacetylase/succinyl-diaminopimelate desuccinylase family protein
METQDVIAQLRGRRKEIVATLADLVAARTVNPPGDEHAAAAVVETFFRRCRIPYEKLEKAPGRTNIVGCVGEGRPRVAVVCHLDTVPAGDGWKTDPFRATVRKGRVYGRGVKDDKGPLASCLAVMEWLKEHENELGGQVLLIGAADEECGSQFGTRFLLKRPQFRKLDAAIVPDAGHRMGTIDVAEKGVLFLKIRCTGRQAHGARPHTGISAIYPMAELAMWLNKWHMPGGTNELFSPPGPTKNVGVISGGAAVNMVPAVCEMQVDMRYLPGTEREELLAAVCNVIDRIERKHRGALFEIEVTNEDVPTQVSTDSAVYRSLSAAVERVTGNRPTPFGMGGVTVTKQFVEAGIPAIGICPGDPNTEHVANESIEVEQLTDFAAVMAICLLDLLGNS